MAEKLKLILMLVVGLVGGFLAKSVIDQKNESDKGIEVIGVIDGDTIVVGSNKVRLRLRNIDAPELEFCGGAESKEALEKLVTGKKVIIEEEIIDNQGRPMALVYASGKLVNKELLAAGWARYHSDSTSKRDEMKEVANIAKMNKIGIFSPKCSQTENTANPKCQIKGNIDPNKPEIKIYQIPGCVQYKTTTVDLDRGEEWFCSEEKAIGAGYRKSERCD